MCVEKYASLSEKFCIAPIVEDGIANEKEEFVVLRIRSK